MSEQEKEAVDQAPDTTAETTPVKKPQSKKTKFMNPDEYSQEELSTLERLYDQSFKDIREGEIISGKVHELKKDK